MSESFDQREKKILQFWKDNRIFERSVEEKKGYPLFSFYDGPPFATGLPHYGHLLAGTIKDVILRYKTMRGFYVPRGFGWDCHGLPVESEIEKAHQLSGAPSIEAFGIEKFNEACRSIVLRYTAEWEDIVKRMGRWVDFSMTYRTMDPTFMESVWWVFKELYQKGLVYQGYKVMPYSAKLGTPLSNFEAGENYKDVDDPSLTVAFSLEDDENTSFLVWTTTPWTLVSNLAIMAGPEIPYVLIEEEVTGKRYILAEAALDANFKDKPYRIIENFIGKEIEGKRYRPLFPYFSARKDAFYVILEESVSLEEGTGLVHAAPAFGEVDFYACQKNGIELVDPVDGNGFFTETIPEYAGLFVKDADRKIIRTLKERGRVFHHGTCRHRYPYCGRSDTPLIYKAVKTWFVSVETLKERLLAANDTIHWTPSHIKEGRFGKWLEGARDWAISRNRYWGTPIPLWMAEDGDILVIGSLDELESLTGKRPKDLHRHHIDSISFQKDGKTYKRIPEVFDCWFESGSMPYAENHYPFENKEAFEKGFPADFIGEGLDQTRGWFYTLLVLSTALFDKPPFKNVVVNGIILAEDGTKMSKRLKNYPDPMVVVEKYGADAIRLYMMHSPAVAAEDLRFSEAGVELVLRQILIPLWNAYSFFTTYSKISGWNKTKYEEPKELIDKWILSCLASLVKKVEEGLDNYDLQASVEPFVGFIESLTNWYIRRTRRIFWEDPSKRQNEAFSTLHTVLMTLVKVAAPFIPFLSEAIFQSLRDAQDPDSVHLADFPDIHDEYRNEALEEGMQELQEAVALGHSLRKASSLKVRQPISQVWIATANPETRAFLETNKHLLQEELNVKEVHFEEDEEKFVDLSVKPNFRILGKKVGKKMPIVQKTVEKLSAKELSKLLKEGNLEISLSDNSILNLSEEDVEIKRVVKETFVAANSDHITMAMDTVLTESLIEEGIARELVNKINAMRKDAGLSVTDRIRVFLHGNGAVFKASEVWQAYIQEEVLAISLNREHRPGKVWDINGHMAEIAIEKLT